MSRPLAVMLSPDGHCRTPGAQAALHAQLTGLGEQRIQIAQTPAAADICLWHTGPGQMRALLAEHAELKRARHVACPSHHGNIDALCDSAAPQAFDAVFASTPRSWARLQQVHARTFWVPPAPAHIEHAPLDVAACLQAQLHLSPETYVMLAIDDGVEGDRTQALACVRSAYAYVRARHPQCALILWHRRYAEAVWRRTVDNVIQLRGTLSESKTHALFATVHALVRLDAGCSHDVVVAMQAGVLCIATDDRAHSGLLTPYNSVPIQTLLGADDRPVLFRDALERQMLLGLSRYRAGTHLSLTRQAQRDVACLRGGGPQALLYRALVRCCADAAGPVSA